MWALSLLAPWPWAIFHAGKDVENRTWKLPPSFAGRRVLIHTSKRVTRDDFDCASEAIERINPTVSVPSYELIPLGAIVGAVTFTGMLEPIARRDTMDGWHHTQQYGWQLANHVELPSPVPCLGARGFWRVPDHVAARIRELAEVAA